MSARWHMASLCVFTWTEDERGGCRSFSHVQMEPPIVSVLWPPSAAPVQHPPCLTCSIRLLHPRTDTQPTPRIGFSRSGTAAPVRFCHILRTCSGGLCQQFLGLDFMCSALKLVNGMLGLKSTHYMPGIVPCLLVLLKSVVGLHDDPAVIAALIGAVSAQVLASQACCTGLHSSYPRRL